MKIQNFAPMRNLAFNE